MAVGKLEEEWEAVWDGKIKELSWSALNERCPSVTNCTHHEGSWTFGVEIAGRGSRWHRGFL